MKFKVSSIYFPINYISRSEKKIIKKNKKKEKKKKSTVYFTNPKHGESTMKCFLFFSPLIAIPPRSRPLTCHQSSAGHIKGRLVQPSAGLLAAVTHIHFRRTGWEGPLVFQRWGLPAEFRKWVYSICGKHQVHTVSSTASSMGGSAGVALGRHPPCCPHVPQPPGSPHLTVAFLIPVT